MGEQNLFYHQNDPLVSASNFFAARLTLARAALSSQTATLPGLQFPAAIQPRQTLGIPPIGSSVMSGLKLCGRNRNNRARISPNTGDSDIMIFPHGQSPQHTVPGASGPGLAGPRRPQFLNTQEEAALFYLYVRRCLQGSRVYHQPPYGRQSTNTPNLVGFFGMYR